MAISTGGGAILSDKNRELMAQRGVVVCLETRPETIYTRLRADTEGTTSPVIRPLLQSKDPLKRIKSLKASRQPYYALADWTIHTDNLTLDEVSAEVVRAWHVVGGKLAGEGLAQAAAEVVTMSARYPIFVGWGWLDKLGSLLHWLGLSGRAVVIGDETVLTLYGQRIVAGLEKDGYEVVVQGVPPGEASKSLDMAAHLYDCLVERRVERGDAILAVGGGVVGDLAGFVAATFLRGLPLVQVPTTLAAMVDASIGGKVAINHP